MRNDDSVTSTVPVLLIVPPFYAHGQPSLGTAVLKSVLARKGIAAKVLYANALYARRIGLDAYRGLMSVVSPDQMYQEQVFARAAHGSDFVPPAAMPPESSFYSRYYGMFGGKKTALGGDEMASATGAVGDFLAEVVAEIGRCRPRIVGLSSLYSQVNASLALAKAIKAEFPHILVVLGGSNCYDEMGEELARQDHVDYVFDGEADEAFPDFCDTVLKGRAPPRDKLVRCQPVTSLENTGIPDYSDFMEQFAAEERASTYLFFETSRGCWWGMKNRCSFCGISDDVMTFRSKSPQTAAAELLELRARHPDYKLYYACDSIFPDAYFDGFFQKLAEGGFDGSAFYQIKPTFDFDQLRMMKRHGIDTLGPGIESLSTRHLKMMKKGTNAATNVALLRNCKEAGIEAKWNHLVALPNDRADDYDQVAELVPLLQHLDPPIITPIYVQRFSPYFDRCGEHGISNLRPMGGYARSFPESVDLMKLAYNFDGDVVSDVRVQPEILARFFLEVTRWYGRWAEGSTELAVFRHDGRIMVRDTRDCAVEAVVEISEADLAVLAACRTFKPRAMVAGDVGDLLRRGFLARLDGGYLTLVCGTRDLDHVPPA